MRSDVLDCRSRKIGTVQRSGFCQTRDGTKEKVAPTKIFTSSFRNPLSSLVTNHQRKFALGRTEPSSGPSTKLKKDYFKQDPLHIIDIWLFKDKASYEKNCRKLIGTRPTTPYGFYSSTNRSLVMNISTGGGTLVHEIVHPFIESNFPECPSWFNEGLASLYEQCREENGKIWGLTNWRLRGLQIHIQD